MKYRIQADIDVPSDSYFLPCDRDKDAEILSDEIKNLFHELEIRLLSIEITKDD